jgi:hypothetical protein
LKTFQSKLTPFSEKQHANQKCKPDTQHSRKNDEDDDDESDDRANEGATAQKSPSTVSKDSSSTKDATLSSSSINSRKAPASGSAKKRQYLSMPEKGNNKTQWYRTAQERRHGATGRTTQERGRVAQKRGRTAQERRRMAQEEGRTAQEGGRTAQERGRVVR